MNSYGLIDLHCDTLAEYWKYAHTGNPDTLDDPGRVLSLSNMPKDVHWAQFYAVFIPDEERGQAAIDYFEKNRAAIIATGGPTEESILETIRAGANAITITPPTTGELFAGIMHDYREKKL